MINIYVITVTASSICQGIAKSTLNVILILKYHGNQAEWHIGTWVVCSQPQFRAGKNVLFPRKLANFPTICCVFLCKKKDKISLLTPTHPRISLPITLPPPPPAHAWVHLSSNICTTICLTPFVHPSSMLHPSRHLRVYASAIRIYNVQHIHMF